MTRGEGFGVPISAVLFEVGRIVSRTAPVDAMPNHAGLIWLCENGYIKDHDLSADGYELLARLSQVLVNAGTYSGTDVPNSG